MQNLIGAEPRARAHDPATGDTCVVWSPYKDPSLKAYSINGGPSALAPAMLACIYQNNPARIAMEMLREHRRAAKATEKEDL